MEFITDTDGFLTEKSIHDLAAWYGGDEEPETFEAHLLVLRVYGTLITSAMRGRRTTMSVERYTMLRLLYRTPDQRLQMGEIGRALNVSPTSVTKLVNSLEGLDLVQRMPHKGDRRRTWIKLTPKGTSLVENSLPEVRAFTRRRWQGLSLEEKRTLIHLLSKLLMASQPSPASERDPEAAASAADNGITFEAT